MRKSWAKAPAESIVPADVFPLAYVGCWLSKCERITGEVGSHRGWKPSAAEVEAFAKLRQWV